MIRKRSGLRAIGLGVLALGVMAFGSSSAQAANWMENGTNLNETLLTPLAASSFHGVLLSRILGIHFELLCSGAVAVNVHLLGGANAGRILGRVRFTGCVTYLNDLAHSKVSVPCEPHTGKEKGVVETVESEGVLGLHEKEGVTVIKPKVGETFTTVETSEECAVGEEIPIIGQLAVKDVGGLAGLEAESVTHEISEFAPLTALWTISKTEEHKATIEGKAAIAISGAMAGDKWSGLPE